MARACTALIVLMTVWVTGGTAVAQDSLRVGARAGANWSLLSRPSDPEGEPTLNSGAAYSGWGFVGGLALLLPIPTDARGAWLIGFDVLVSRHNSTGTVEVASAGQSRTTELNTTVVRLPLHAGYGYREKSLGVRLSLGPELLLGIGSGATVSEVGMEEAAKPLDTTPVTHLGLTGILGFDYRTADWVIPVEFRFTYDPMVPSSTRDRFDGFEDGDNPGNFQVAHDVQILMMLGIDYNLDLAK